MRLLSLAQMVLALFAFGAWLTSCAWLGSVVQPGDADAASRGCPPGFVAPGSCWVPGSAELGEVPHGR